jgi:two-component system, sensor histidine kinase and response regulator
MAEPSVFQTEENAVPAGAERVSGSRFASLATMPTNRDGYRLALVVAVSCVLACIATLPFMTQHLAVIPAFVPTYQAALGINDLVTAVLLLDQSRHLRSYGLLVLALGYLFTTCMVIAHTLSFPGVFAVGGLLGGGAQSTAWLYTFWHGGFPIFVIAYALLMERPGRGGHRRQRAYSVSAAVVPGLVAVIAVVIGLTLLATRGQALLPMVLADNTYTAAQHWAARTIWTLVWIALACLLWRRPRSELDLWLMVVMCAWLCDIALSAVFNAGRYDVGFYAGRFYGLLASCALLVILLLETSSLHGRLAAANAQIEDYANSLETRVRQRTAELARSNKALAEFAHAAAHDLRAPLVAITHLAEWVRSDIEGKVDAQVLEHLALLHRRAERMEMLLDASAAYARSEEDAAQVERVEIAVLVADIVASLEPGPGFVVTYSGEIVAIETDRASLERVLSNLIGNAIVHHDRESGSVEVRARQADDVIEFCVADDGPGIAPQQQERIFAAFHTLAPRDEVETSGIGLTIVRRTVEAVGGTVWVESAPPARGSRFLFTWV